MADEEVEVQEPDEKDLRIKALEEELTQHKKLFDLHRAVLEPYASKIMKDMVSKLEINIKEKYMAVKKKRARTKKGTYKADNPKTPTINEAYVASVLGRLSEYYEAILYSILGDINECH